jgi:DNA mismatch endonuclease (patch repair protein)
MNSASRPAARERQPFASSPTARRHGQRQARKDTAPELALRRALHAQGLRYLVHRRPLPALRRIADLIFVSAKVAVFVDGCFWHGCPDHGIQPQTNSWYWAPKLERNRQRDADTTQKLEGAGWIVMRVWEHEDPVEAARRIEGIVQARRGAQQRVQRSR